MPGFLFVNLDKAPKDFYEITATLPEGTTKDDVPAMLRNLLIDRFHLKYHRELREVKRFELHVAPTGHKMKDGSKPLPPNPQEQPIYIKPGTDGYVEFVPGRNMGPVGFSGRWGMQRVEITMVDFARELQGFFGGVMTDLTGLTGKYDFVLKWNTTLNTASPDGTNVAEFSDPPLLVALREQLGLVVRQVKGSSEVIVIDDMAADPTPN
jgi:uncharacterized protein (TIGR03435 family)